MHRHTVNLPTWLRRLWPRRPEPPARPLRWSTIIDMTHPLTPCDEANMRGLGNNLLTNGRSITFVADVTEIVHPSIPNGATRLILEDFTASGVVIAVEHNAWTVECPTPSGRKAIVRVEFERMKYLELHT